MFFFIFWEYFLYIAEVHATSYFDKTITRKCLELLHFAASPNPNQRSFTFAENSELYCETARIVVSEN